MENERPENACLTKVQTRCGGVWGYAPPATWHAKVNSQRPYDSTRCQPVSDKTIRIPTRVCINYGIRRSGPRRLNPVRSRRGVRRSRSRDVPLVPRRISASRAPPTPHPRPRAATSLLGTAAHRVGRWVLIYKCKNRGRVDCTLSVTLPIPLQLNHFTTSPCVRADGPGCATQAFNRRYLSSVTSVKANPSVCDTLLDSKRDTTSRSLLGVSRDLGGCLHHIACSEMMPCCSTVQPSGSSNGTWKSSTHVRSRTCATISAVGNESVLQNGSAGGPPWSGQGGHALMLMGRGVVFVASW